MRGVFLVLLVGCGARSGLDVSEPHDAGTTLEASAQPSCTPLTIATNVSGVTQLLLDGDYLFFNGNELGRVLTNGGPIESMDACCGAGSLAVDDQNIYFTDLGGGGVSSKPKLSDSTLLASLGGPVATGLAVNATGVYSSSGPTLTWRGDGHGYGIWKLPYNGYPQPSSPIASLPGGGDPGQLTFGSDGLLYGIMEGTNGGIIRTDTSGSFIETVALVDQPTAMAVDASGIYVASYGATGFGVMRIDSSGSAPPFFYTHDDSIPPVSVAVDATTVYWTDRIRNVINASPKDHASVTAFVNDSTPTAVTVDDQCVYYATYPSGEQTEEIRRIPKP